MLFRIALEGEIEALKDEMERTIRSKSQVTTAVLEALAKEKSKSHTLEQTLQDVLPTSPRTPSGTGRQELPDYNATTSLKQPLYRREYPSPTSQDEYEALETHRKAFLSVSPLQGLSSASAQIQACVCRNTIFLLNAF